MNTTRFNVKKMVLAALMLALCMVLPFLTGQIPQIGSALLPMHFPVLLCGFVCGGPWGAAVGFVAPLLRYLLFGMPPIYPTGLAMAFELATYGLVSGLVYARAKKHTLPMIYAALVAAMVAGRLVWGVVRFLMAGLAGTAFTLDAFLAAVVLGSIPGIILLLILIPLLVVALQRAKVIE